MLILGVGKKDKMPPERVKACYEYENLGRRAVKLLQNRDLSTFSGLALQARWSIICRPIYQSTKAHEKVSNRHERHIRPGSPILDYSSL